MLTGQMFDIHPCSANELCLLRGVDQ